MALRVAVADSVFPNLDPAREVLRFRDAAFHTYYTDPRYLGMVGRKFGPDTVDRIRQMTTTRLERDLLTGKLEVPPTLLPRDGAAGGVLTLGRR